tara:strand:+ start:58 stop:1275 length:1218 start_codon:yes stop_codon:yes gene_type:complete
MKKDWEVKNLSDICEVFVDGNWIESKDQSQNGIRLVQTGNIGFGYFKNKIDKARYVSEDTFKRLKCTEIFPNDILTSRLPDPVGKSCLIPNINSKMITGVDCTIIRTKKNVLPFYLLYFQMSNQYLNEVKSMVTGTTRSRISRKNLGLINVPIAPINEQKRIVEKLDTCMEQIDKAIKNVEQNIQNAEDFLQSSLDNFIFNNSFSNKKMINNLCEFNRGLTFSKIDRVENSSFKVLRANNIHLDDYKINFEKLQFLDESKSYNESKKIRKNSVLMCISSGSKKHLGKIAFIDDHYDNYYFGGFMGQLTPLKDINPKYFFYCLKTSDFKYLIQSLTDGMGINNLKYDSIKSFEIPTISIDKQDAVVNQIEQTISNHDSLKLNYNQQLTSLNELKQSILEKAFNGEL